MGKNWHQRFLRCTTDSRIGNCIGQNNFEEYSEATRSYRCVCCCHLPVETISHLCLIHFPFFADAVEVILLHSSSVYSILNRRGITKDNLFKYLHEKKVPVTDNFTKQHLIEKILQFWRKSFCPTCEGKNSVQITELPRDGDGDDDKEDSDDDEINEVVMTETEHFHYSHGSTIDANDQEHFPINQMARKFASWFYTNLNAGTLREIDFWRDAFCSVQFLERGIVMVDQEHNTNENVCTFCQDLRTHYELYFNLNESHVGTQGRIDSHGLVLVLSCGTLHKIDQMVGIFECVFGLARDPFSENNWKINRMKMRLHNNPIRQKQRPIALDECETLAPLLSITVSSTDEGIG